MAGNLSASMRENYAMGVSNYYEAVHASYRNPHFEGVKKVLHAFMDKYEEHEELEQLDVVDLAAGSGEASEALFGWRDARWPSRTACSAPAARTPGLPHMRLPPGAVRAQQAAQQTNTRRTRPDMRVVACDPFTGEAHKQRTGRECFPLSFSDVANGQLPPSLGSEELHDVCIISFALHLVESTSELWALLTALSERCRWLVVIAPHKKPEIKPSWGWQRWDPAKWEAADEYTSGQGDADMQIIKDRVRLRLYRSQAL